MSDDRSGMSLESFVVAGLIGILVLGGCSRKNVSVSSFGTEAEAGIPAAPAKALPQAQTVIPEKSSAPPKPLQGFQKAPTDEAVEPSGPSVMAKVAPQERPAPKAAPKRDLPDVYFDFDRWALSTEARKILAESAEVLKQRPAAQLRIEGNCDERGTPEYNLVLGEKRAKAAYIYLADLGIKNPVKIISYGKERPICTEQDESCYWKNRRAHLAVEPGP